MGANVNRVFNGLPYPPAQAAALMRALAATGADTARSDALWEVTEPAPGHFDWSFDDTVAGELAAAGLRWLPIVDYAPSWAAVQPGLLHSPPAKPATYATFAAALARRYGPRGTFWAAHPGLTARPVQAYEIWNEPDDQFWAPAPDLPAYARLYLAARAAIHAVDPAALALVGGLVHPATTLPALVAAAPALRGALDGVAIHPYGETTATVLGVVRDARATLGRLGLGPVPLFVTEFGWVTSPAGARYYVPEAERPALVRNTVAALGHTDCGVAGELLYTWVTPRQNPADEEDWYGIEPASGGASPDVAAFAAGLTAARAPSPRSHLCG